MGTSADHDHDHEKDDEDEKHEKHDEEEEEEEERPVAKKRSAPAKAPASKRKGADEKSAHAQDKDKNKSKGEDEDEEEDDEEDGDEEDGEEEKPAAKAATRPGRPPRTRGPGAARGERSKPPSGSSLGKSVVLFVVIVSVVGLGFMYFMREPPAQPVQVKWTTGQTVDVEVTLVKDDRQNLTCASTEEVAGHHCAFESEGKAWSKGGATDDKTIFKPYTTTDRIQFVATGLWSEPALASDKLPAARFSVKCKYKVEGTMKNLSVRWDPASNWYKQENWYAGTVSNCSLN